MASHDEKAAVEHIDRTERSSSPSNTGSDTIEPVRTVDSTNEEIVRNLQTSGEDVGLTFRSVMAALVS